MEDQTFSTELIRRWRAGVPVRILMDPRANAGTPLNATRLAELGEYMYLGPGADRQVTLPFALPPNTTIYWRVTSRTLANLATTGEVWRFTTAAKSP